MQAIDDQVGAGVLRFDHRTLGQRVLFGAGRAVGNAGEAVRDLSASRVLLIADLSVAATADALAHSLPVTARIDGVAQHVPVSAAADAVRIAETSGADVVVSVGGGSSTGLAKAVAKETGLPIVAVPTTFAGSEATDVWGLTDNGAKRTGSDPAVLPRVVVYDTDLLRTLPPELAVASGLNAVAHAVDGFWAPRVDPINRALGTEGLRALVPGLRALHADATGAALEGVLYGAYLAAVAFASAGSGLHHKICHVLGGRYGLPHAPMHAVVLPYVAQFNAPTAPDAAQRVSAAFGGAEPAAALDGFRRELGAAGSLADLGLREAELPDAARLCLDAVPAGNPRPVTLEGLLEILRRAWRGDDLREGRER